MAKNKEVTLGGDRLGAGKKQKVHLRNYERSNHNLSYAWRSTIATGTLVPFISEVALPGDTFDIDLQASVLTHPTIGPLFGTFKLQLDVFAVPVRLFQAGLHMNLTKIGLDMSKVKLPLIELEAKPIRTENLNDDPNGWENSQINPSCVLNYLGMRGLGSGFLMAGGAKRQFNALSYLMYVSIYKQYYANKVEEIGAVIHNGSPSTDTQTTLITFYRVSGTTNIPFAGTPAAVSVWVDKNSYFKIAMGDMATSPDYNFQLEDWDIYFEDLNGNIIINQADSRFETITQDRNTEIIVIKDPSNQYIKDGAQAQWKIQKMVWNPKPTIEPQVTFFPLEDIDKMRIKILQKDMATPFMLTKAETLKPYSYLLAENTMGAETVYSKTNSQEGLLLKTYNSDLFNNWINTEWIDGTDGISEVTAINVVDDQVLIDEVNLKQKLYKMMNAIAVSGGTYDDYLHANYDWERNRGQEEAAYLGGLIQEIVFEEVISMAPYEDQPTGTLSGRGTLANNQRGGKVIAKIDEPSYIIGIASITPRIDYSQGNRWDVNLTTMRDFHVPALDEIGFQDLITDKMAFWDTTIRTNGTLIEKSVGKQPAWLDYMTNYNRTYSNFAVQGDQMWMTLNRNYEPEWQLIPGTDEYGLTIKDLTTYIDPKKFNYIFADVSRSAQNIWLQIGVGINARRKMSAKLMPNL